MDQSVIEAIAKEKMKAMEETPPVPEFIPTPAPEPPPAEPAAKVTEPAPDPVKPDTPAPPVFDKKDYLRTLAQKAELGDFDDEEAVIGAIRNYREKASKAEENPYANEMLRKGNEYVKQGGDLGFFLQTQSIDVDGLKSNNPDELLFLHKKLTEGSQYGIDDETLRIVVENKYTIDTEKFDFEPADLAARKYERAKAIAEAERFLKDWKVQNEVPPAEIERQKQQRTLEQMAETYRAQLEQAMNGGEITVAGTPIKIEWKDDRGGIHPTAKKVKAAMENPDEFIMQTFSTDGKMFDPKRIRDVAYILSNLDNIGSIIANKGRSAGVEEIIDKVENPSTPGQDARPGSGAKTPYQQALEELAKRTYGR